jgi:hypothetical protein
LWVETKNKINVSFYSGKRKRLVTAEEEKVIEHFPAGSFCFIVPINSRDGKREFTGVFLPSPKKIARENEHIFCIIQ